MKDRNNNDKLYNYLNNKRVRECSFSSLGCKNNLNLFTEEDVFNHNFEHLNEHMSLIVRRMNEMLNEHKEIKKRYHRIEKILSNLQAFKSYSINIKNDNDKNNNKIYQKKNENNNNNSYNNIIPNHINNNKYNTNKNKNNNTHYCHNNNYHNCNAEDNNNYENKYLEENIIYIHSDEDSINNSVNNYPEAIKDEKNINKNKSLEDYNFEKYYGNEYNKNEEKELIINDKEKEDQNNNFPKSSDYEDSYSNNSSEY